MGDGESGSLDADAAAGRSARRRRRSRRRAIFVLVVAAAAGVGAAWAGCHPTGTPGVDPAFAALTAALVTLAASRSPRSTLLIMAAVAVVMSRGWLLAPAGAGLALAFGAVFPDRAYQRVAVTGGLIIQVVLRWPSVGFQGATALVAALVVTPVLVCGWRRQRGTWRRATLIGAGSVLGLAVVFAGLVFLSGLLARGQVDRGLTAARAALDDLNGSTTQPSVAQLDAATYAFGVAHSRTSAWWTLGGRLVPLVAQQSRVMADTTSAVHGLVAAAAREARGPQPRQPSLSGRRH